MKFAIVLTIIAALAQDETSATGRSICGDSLIAPNVMLTTAHASATATNWGDVANLLMDHTVTTIHHTRDNAQAAAALKPIKVDNTTMIAGGLAELGLCCGGDLNKPGVYSRFNTARDKDVLSDTVDFYAGSRGCID
ncbi:hypothetical protein H257_16290 [Aphanomyces astaci]|uniref:Peptidase S1 domain-containing protein n=1 Tax=Aphanomyces astaci TaxID=112090 RepID=W4FL79_APHAT|nr:hypothetical protein H257_16290 [Aphanomyces astaci]ETV67559.1 hypothetical protein H257_16290 [Aphanomyces astaci]|eukprot:XP_009842963.1 hypothetical protein H257_16290 [Aphanomyces astaci]